MSFLKNVLKAKKEEVRLIKKDIKNIELSVRKGNIDYFLNSITKDCINVIAEVKKASPSTGLLRKNLDPVRLASEYYNNGANAISVVTDRTFFKGDIETVKNIKDNFAIPVLRKDFIIDSSQIIESRAKGADAILLIAKILSARELKRFVDISNDLGMGVIIEIHDEEDLKKALKTENRMIGINNRDLETLDVKINTSIRLSNKIPSDRIKIVESGISSIKDISLLKEIGFKVFLIGTYLISHTDPGGALREIKSISLK